MNAPFVHLSNFRILIDERVIEEIRSLGDHDRNRVLTAIHLAKNTPVLASLSESEIRFMVMYDGVFLLLDFVNNEETFVIRAFFDDFDGDDPLPPSSVSSTRTNIEVVLGSIGVDVELHLMENEDKAFDLSQGRQFPTEEQSRILALPAGWSASAPSERACGISDDVTRKAELITFLSYVTTLASAVVAIRPQRAVSLFAFEENPELSASASTRPIP